MATVTVPSRQDLSKKPRLATKGKVVKVADSETTVETSDADAKRVKAATDAGAEFSAETEKVSAEASPNSKEIPYTWLKVNFKTAQAALAYFEGKESDVLEAINRAVNTNRKQNARASAINEAVPEADRKMAQAAKRLADSKSDVWGTDEDHILAYLKNPLVYDGKMPGQATFDAEGNYVKQ